MGTGYRHLIGKRDADAEPEADADALLYNAAYTSPLVYRTNAFYNNYYNGAFPYTTYGALPAYTGYTGLTGYAGLTGYRHLIGKRDADADALLYHAAGYYPHLYNAALPHGVVATP